MKWLERHPLEGDGLASGVNDGRLFAYVAVPVFMYLADYREYCLEDVITQLEPRLFKKVTGLEVEDFNLLCSLNVFNASLMNDAVYKFKRYEDASLEYTGLMSMHEGEGVGLYNTVLSAEDYAELDRQRMSAEGL